MKTLFFITGNQGKVLEVKKKFKDLDIKIVQKDLGYPEIQAKNLEDVVCFGVEHIQKKFSFPFIIEDAGLFIDALDGFPGVFSAYVYQTIGCSGILRLMRDLEVSDRSACFRSIFAFSETGKKPRIFKGECKGMISKNKLGEHGFGYDPIFIPHGEMKTFAQMDIYRKNNFSHRGKSINKLIDFFKNM
jgi:XTP/dITP diphosphohydrolase